MRNLNIRSTNIILNMLEDNIEMDLREIGLCGMDWIDFPQDRDQWRSLVNKVMKFRVP
jgi:hypothetical protein